MTVGSRATFESLYRTHYRAVHGFVGRRLRPDLVDDATQEVFLIAWRRADDAHSPGLGWLLGIARNVVGERYRFGSRLQEIDHAATELARVTGSHQNGVDEQVLENLVVLSALGRLSTADRDVLLLTAWDDLSPADAADTLGCSTATYRMRLSRARARFQRALADIETPEALPQQRSSVTRPTSPRHSPVGPTPTRHTASLPTPAPSP